MGFSATLTSIATQKLKESLAKQKDALLWLLNAQDQHLIAW